MLSRIRRFFCIKTEYEQMEDYYSQAVDLIHLEMLMKKWEAGHR